MLKKAERTLALFLAAIMLFSLAACSVNAPGTKDYVDSVSNEMLEAVNMTRKLKKLQELDIRKNTNSGELNSTLDSLDKIYTRLLKLDAPSDYEELDSELKASAEAAIGYMNEISSLVKTAEETGNDSLYKQESIHIMKDYEVSYNELVEINSRITTKYRND